MANWRGILALNTYRNTLQWLKMQSTCTVNHSTDQNKILARLCTGMMNQLGFVSYFTTDNQLVGTSWFQGPWGSHDRIFISVDIYEYCFTDYGCPPSDERSGPKLGFVVKVTLRPTTCRSVCLGFEPHLGLMTRYELLCDSYCFVDIWREVGSVIWFSHLNCFSSVQ
jgi:hypothetical protein